MFGGGDPSKQPFGLGATTTSAQQTGFSFASPTTGTAFGTPASQPQPSAFSQGSTAFAASTSLFGGGASVPAGTTITPIAPFGSGTPSIFGTTTPGVTGFGFGGTTTSAATQPVGGFPAFGGTAAAPAASTATPSLGLGATAFATPGATTGISGFGNAFDQKSTTAAITTTAAPFGFGTPAFGSTAAAPQTLAQTATTLPSTGFQFGSSQGTPFNLGATTTTAAAPASTTTPFMGFGQAITSAPGMQASSGQTGSLLAQSLSTPASSLGFPTPSPVTTAATSLPAFGSIPTATATGGITFGTPTTIAKPASFATTTAAATTANLTFGTAPVTTATAPTILGATTGLATGFAFGAPPAKTTTPGFTLGTAATSSSATTAIAAPLATAATTAGQSLLVSKAPITTTTQGALTATAPTAPPAGPTAVPAGASINFRKLEEDINKWTSELEEQERIFLTQATQVNAWDRVLIANGDKITQLNDALERVKLDQEHLDQEVDFIQAQQRELEELLVPLEKSVESLPNLSIHQHADLEREQTFQMAENIDAQLRQMSKDLKEIIEHINTTAGTQDTNDPIYQISKILNAHMDSLQWIDQNTAQLQKRVEEVGHLYEARRQDHQRGVQLPF